MPITQPKIHTEIHIWTRSGNSFRLVIPVRFEVYKTLQEPFIVDVDGVEHYFNPEYVEHATYREFDANEEAK
jgi:hypothetical protein